jgi:hypothetical protein
MIRCALLFALISSAPAAAADRLDHHGAVGLLIGSGLDVRQAASPTGNAQTGLRLPIDLGGTYNVGHDSNELKLVLRGELLGTNFIGSIYGGYRGYFGHDAWKTFFDLDLRADLFPQLTAGPRMGLGVQYEVSSLIGVYCALAAHVGAGQGIRFGGELTVGVQLRSYLLE